MSYGMALGAAEGFQRPVKPDINTAGHAKSSLSPQQATLGTHRCRACNNKTIRGAPTGGEGSDPPPLGPEKHYIFRVSSVKLLDLHV